LTPRASAAFSCLLLLVLLAIGCGGDEEATLQPLAPPPVSPNLAVHGQGQILLEVGPNGRHVIDMQALDREAGASTPCSGLILLFSWRTEGDRSLEFVQTMPDNDVKVQEGQEGVASVTGCSPVEARNKGGSVVKGELKYVLATSR
jgi:hypothetical protein